MKILFVEDEKELNTVACQELSNMGHKVLSAINLEQARRLLSLHSDSIDMILADHRLPDGQGISFIMEARQQKEKLKVAVVSGVLTEEEKEFLDAEGVRYFLKPLLYTNVIRALTRPPTNAPLARKPSPLEAPTEDAPAETEQSDTPKRTFWSSLFRRSP